VLDDLGIYYDPIRPSRLEALIAQSPALPEIAHLRARRLISALCEADISKYNLDLELKRPPIPAGQPVILVPGQVEDDASIRLGAGEITTNLGLLKATRAANPEAYIIYKPHPDVEAGLRPGIIENAADYANWIADHAPIMPLIKMSGAVWTLTSLTGFEALLRGKAVTCLGTPFYAGWGLTDDHSPCPRRREKPSLEGLVHATLIDYPLYLDPKTGNPCAPELLIQRLQNGEGKTRLKLRVLAKLQGGFANYAYLWR